MGVVVSLFSIPSSRQAALDSLVSASTSAPKGIRRLIDAVLRGGAPTQLELFVNELFAAYQLPDQQIFAGDVDKAWDTIERALSILVDRRELAAAASHMLFKEAPIDLVAEPTVYYKSVPHVRQIAGAIEPATEAMFLSVREAACRGTYGRYHSDVPSYIDYVFGNFAGARDLYRQAAADARCMLVVMH